MLYGGGGARITLGINFLQPGPLNKRKKNTPGKKKEKIFLSAYPQERGGVIFPPVAPPQPTHNLFPRTPVAPNPSRRLPQKTNRIQTLPQPIYPFFE